MDSKVGNGVVEDAKNGIVLMNSEWKFRPHLAGKLGPLGSANGARRASVPDVRGDAEQVEGMGALRREDGLAPWY